MGSQPVTYDEYVRLGLPALERVFPVPNPFEPSHGPSAEAMAIVYPIGPLDPQQWHVVAGAAGALGETALWVTSLQRATSYQMVRPGRFRTDDRELLSLAENWLLPLDAYDQYAAGRFAGRDHAIHSRSGAWAILVSWEFHAVIGGETDFVDRLLDELILEDMECTAREAVGTWLREQRQRSDLLKAKAAWVPKATVAVYGADRAGELLCANGWADFVP